MAMVFEPDAAKVAAAWKAVLEGLGYDTTEEHLKDSPARVARFLCEWHTRAKPPPKLTTFASEAYDELVVVSGITFHSMCAHHGLPFFGTAAVGYLPGADVIGLSKLARVVDHFAHRYSTQERIGAAVSKYLMEELSPRGVGVVLEAEHMCMSMRGVLKPGATTITSVMLGTFRDSPEARAELLTFVRHK